VAVLALLLAPAGRAQPAAASGADLSVAVTAATGQLRQAWAADPTTAALPFPRVRLLQPGASVAGTCNPKAPPLRPAATAAFCDTSGEVVLDQDLLADAYGKAPSSQGRLLVSYWIAIGLAERLLPMAADGAASPALRTLQATCQGGVLLGATPARQASSDATPLLFAARAAYGDRYRDAVGTASQRGYALLTGLGATATPSCGASDMAALVRGAVPDPALLAKVDQLPPPERGFSSLLGAFNSQCRPLPKRHCPRSVATN
ncbi:MAG: hypothetical protein WCL59_10930, partial [Cyanobium sp. ELA507]